MSQLFEDGRAANSAGRPAEGERLLRRALAREAELDRLEEFPGGDGTTPAPVVARTRIWLTLSTALMERRGAQEALAAVDEALRLAADSPMLTGMCHSQRAMLLGRSGRPTEALSSLEVAARALDRMPPRDQFVVLISRGVLQMEVGEVVGAQQDFRTAVQLCVTHGMVDQEFMARHNLGHAVALAGDLPEALRLMLEADKVPSQISRAVAMRDRGRLLLEAGLISEAARLLSEATDQGRSRRQRLTVAEIELELARALVLLGDHRGAVLAARRARRGFGSGAPAWQRRTDLVLLVAQCHTGRRLADVARRAGELAAAFDARGDRVAKAEARLVQAEALARSGHPDEASDLLAESGKVLRSGTLTTALRYRRVAATIATAQGHPGRAGRQLRAARTTLAKALATSGSVDLRAASTLHAEELAALDRNLAGDRGPTAVLHAQERWRALSAAAPAVRPPDDPELGRAVIELRRLRATVRKNPEAEPEVLQQVNSMERVVTTLSWAARGPALQPGLITTEDSVAKARQRSREGIDVVMYGHDGDRLGAVVLSRGRCRLVDLGPWTAVVDAQLRLTADLTALTSVGQTPVREVISASLTRSLQQCSELLLAPLGLGEEAVVIPAERMAALPWGMLPDRAGRPTTIAPSLATWLREPSVPQQVRVSAVAGPGLAMAPGEVATVAGLWNASAPQGLGSGTDLRQALAESDLVHVAAHGTHQPESPLLSSIWLDDGPMSLCDLEQGERSASLVVVSACDAGRSHARGRGQHLGLASGLLALGVSSVVAAVCPVPDRAAADVMPRYHRQLVAGVESSRALALAIAESDDPLAGAFVALGAPWRRGSGVQL